LTSKRASRHNGVHFLNISTSKSGLRPRCFEHFDFKIGSVQFFISYLHRWLRTRRFSEPTFRPAGATKHWKKSASRLFHIFAHFDLLSTDSFSLDPFSSPTPLTTVAALAHKSEVWFLTSFDYVVYWSNSIYIVANWDDDHNGRGVEPSKLWYRWPMFSWNNKKEPGEKKLGCLKTIRIPHFSQVEEDNFAPNGFKWQNLVWFTLWWFEIAVESRHKSGKTSNYCWVIASICFHSNVRLPDGSQI